MKKTIAVLVLVAALLSLAGCAKLKQTVVNGLSVVESSVILGGQPPVQKVSFRLELHNGGKQNIRVDSVKPVVDSAFQAMMQGKQDLTVTVGKDIAPGENLTVSGKFQLKTNGIPKEQLNKMGKVVKSFQVFSRVSFAAPDLETETAGEDEAKNEAAAVPKATPTPKP